MDLDLIHVSKLHAKLVPKDDSISDRAGLVRCREACIFWMIFRHHLHIGREPARGENQSLSLDLIQMAHPLPYQHAAGIGDDVDHIAIRAYVDIALGRGRSERLHDRRSDRAAVLWTMGAVTAGSPKSAD